MRRDVQVPQKEEPVKLDGKCFHYPDIPQFYYSLGISGGACIFLTYCALKLRKVSSRLVTHNLSEGYEELVLNDDWMRREANRVPRPASKEGGKKEGAQVTPQKQGGGAGNAVSVKREESTLYENASSQDVLGAIKVQPEVRQYI